MAGFTKFTAPKEVKVVLDHLLQNPRPRGFATEIKDESQNLTYEGARPLSCSEVKGERTYTLTNSDSQYTRPIGSVKLEDVTLVSMLPSMIDEKLRAKLLKIRSPKKTPDPQKSKDPEGPEMG